MVVTGEGGDGNASEATRQQVSSRDLPLDFTLAENRPFAG